MLDSTGKICLFLYLPANEVIGRQVIKREKKISGAGTDFYGTWYLPSDI